MSVYPGTGTVDGKRGDHVLIAPAYDATAEEIEHIADVAAQVIEQYFDRL